MNSKSWMVAAMALSMVGGCVDESIDGEVWDEAEGEVGKADEPGGSGTELTTRSSAVELLVGYHGLFDRVSSTCVTADSPSTVVGETSERYDLVYVSSRDELARELGLDLDLKARWAGLSADAGVDALHKLSSSATTVNLVLELEQGYSVAEQSELRLSPVGEQALADGAQAFARTCGSNYVGSVEYGSSFTLLVSLECESASVAAEIKASLGVDTPAAIPVDGSVKANLERATKHEKVKVQVQAIARGFELKQSVSTLGKDGLDAAAFAAIDQIRGDMRDSIGRDMEFDVCSTAGSGCSGVRRAVPSRVKVGFYGDLPGVGHPEVFRQIRDHWARIEGISTSVSRAHERLEAAHGELRDFLGADEQGQYNVYEPGTPQATSRALRELATARKAQLDPGADGTAGHHLFDTLQACWGRASDDVGYGCDDLEWESQVQAANDLLRSYGDEARILPLDLLYVDASTAWWEIWATTDPVAACREVSPNGSYRLPRPHELPLVATMVADGPIDWGSAQANAIWYDDASACGGGERPYYANDGYGEPTLGCSSDTDYITTVLCVPVDGPQLSVQPI